MNFWIHQNLYNKPVLINRARWVLFLYCNTSKYRKSQPFFFLAKTHKEPLIYILFNWRDLMLQAWREKNGLWLLLKLGRVIYVKNMSKSNISFNRKEICINIYGNTTNIITEGFKTFVKQRKYLVLTLSLYSLIKWSSIYSWSRLRFKWTMEFSKFYCQIYM